MFLTEGLRVRPGIADRFAYLLTTRGTLLVRIDASPDGAHSAPKRPDRGSGRRVQLGLTEVPAHGHFPPPRGIGRGELMLRGLLPPPLANATRQPFLDGLIARHGIATPAFLPGRDLGRDLLVTAGHRPGEIPAVRLSDAARVAVADLAEPLGVSLLRERRRTRPGAAKPERMKHAAVDRHGPTLRLAADECKDLQTVKRSTLTPPPRNALVQRLSRVDGGRARMATAVPVAGTHTTKTAAL